MKQVGDRLDLGFEVKVVRGAGADPVVVQFSELVTGPTVVSVYMRNHTGSCDRQMESLGAQAARIRQRGWSVVAVSRDTAGSHGRYAIKQRIGHALVSDPTDLFATATDAMVEKKMYGRTFTGPLRSAWLLQGDGTIQAVIEKVDVKEHGHQVVAAIDALSSRE